VTVDRLHRASTRVSGLALQIENDFASKAAWYRERAADCVGLAERSQMTNAGFAYMAARWLRLAELMEEWAAEREA
jgi:hypothetical protein